MVARASLGLIAGSGRLPVVLAEAMKARGYGLIALMLEDQPALAAAADHAYTISFGDVGGIAAHLARHGVRRVYLSGTVSRSSLITEGDVQFRRTLASAADRRDQAAFATVFLPLMQANGIEIGSPLEFLRSLVVGAGVLTTRAPSGQEREDIRFGMQIARAVADLDIGQTVVCKDGVILAVEAAEGTDDTIRRGARMGRGVVVAKAARSEQDNRFDLPAIGLTTIETMQQVGATALAVDSGRALLIDREESLAAADRAGITIVGVERTEPGVRGSGLGVRQSGPAG